MESFCRCKILNILRLTFITLTVYLLVRIIGNDFKTEPNRYLETMVTIRNESRLFRIDNYRRIFLKDNRPFRILSGELHYFRIPLIYWNDRIRKVREAGLNTIQTYVPWNFHNFQMNEYLFSRERNLIDFIKKVHQHNMLLLLRIGPYICAEWDMGGLPAWLFTINPKMKLRSSAKDYIREVKKWFSLLLPKIKPFLYANGGPIIMIQLENEYGSFGCDKDYMNQLYTITRAFIPENTILYTTDRNKLDELNCGSSPKFFPTIDFGPNENPNQAFRILQSYRSDVPLMNSEFYTGWLTYWGCKLGSSDVGLFKKALWKLIRNPEININFYVMHGGTNFGFSNGAGDIMSPFITSYDYDAPISESGELKLKYYIIRDAIYKYKNKKQDLNDAEPTTPTPYLKPIKVTKRSDFLRELLLRDTQYFKKPKTMEQLRMYAGYIIYQTSTAHINVNYPSNVLIQGLSDIGYIFTGKNNNQYITYIGQISRANLPITIQIKLQDALIILVENTGHVSYGSNIFSDVKGLFHNVIVNQTIVLENWSHILLDADQVMTPNQLSILKSTAPSQGSLYEGTFDIEDNFHDSFLHLKDFTKGFVIINGHNLGRFWNIGPQFSLYIPVSFLKPIKNTIKIFELGNSECSVCYVHLKSFANMNNDRAGNC